MTGNELTRRAALKLSGAAVAGAAVVRWPQSALPDANAKSLPTSSYEPQPQESLRQVIDINYRLGPHTPKGLEDSAVGVLHDTLISVGGWNNGSGPGGRGFLNDAWGIDLGDLEYGWVDLPPYPGSNDPSDVDGAGRQAMGRAVFNNELYTWGGFNYTAPYAYADGYKLNRSSQGWSWTSLPSLPTPRASVGMVSIGTKIYSTGGADYDSNAFYTGTDRTGTLANYGSRVYVFDAARPNAGWRELPPLPGTPRWVHAAAAVGNKIYVIGGATGNGYTVVDNWVLDTSEHSWRRIRDLPVASGNFPAGRIVVEDRYVLLVGGYQYGLIQNPDGSTRPVYGTPTKAFPDQGYFSDVWVYDTVTDLFGTATPLPVNNNLPASVVANGALHMIGGETPGGETVFGQSVDHNPDLYLIGDLHVRPAQG